MGGRGEAGLVVSSPACLIPHLRSVWPLPHASAKQLYKPSPLPLPPTIRFKEAMGPRNQDPGGHLRLICA